MTHPTPLMRIALTWNSWKRAQSSASKGDFRQSTSCALCGVPLPEPDPRLQVQHFRGLQTCALYVQY